MFIGSDAQGGERCLRLVRGRDFNVGRVGILVVDYWQSTPQNAHPA